MGTTCLQNPKKRLISICTWITSSCLQKKKKNYKIEEFDTNNKNIQPRYWNGIWHRKICDVHNEKWEKGNNGTNIIAKSSKSQNGHERNSEKWIKGQEN